MTKQEKIQEIYGEKYDCDKDGWLWYSVDEHGEYGYEPFGEHETRNHKDGSYEWRPISLRGIENNNGWSRVEDGKPEKEGFYDVSIDGKYFYYGLFYNGNVFREKHEHQKTIKATHFRPVDNSRPLY